MHRKKFLLTAFAATPVSLLAKIQYEPAIVPFKVDAGKSRFGETRNESGRSAVDYLAATLQNALRHARRRSSP